jgi:uncharacterized ion transporter superfamily protein YfcC
MAKRNRRKTPRKKELEIEVLDEPAPETRKVIKKNQAILTLFILVFPVLILSMVGVAGDWAMRLCLFFYEAILIKNFIDDYYSQDKILEE